MALSTARPLTNRINQSVRDLHLIDLLEVEKQRGFAKAQKLFDALSNGVGVYSASRDTLVPLMLANSLDEFAIDG